MVTEGTKTQLKVERISNGREVLRNTITVLDETLSALKSGDKRQLAKLPTKITLLLKTIIVVDGYLEDVLRFDGHLRLSQDLIKTNNAKKNKEQVIKNRLQTSTPTTNKRKSDSLISLEMTVKSSTQQNCNWISPTPRKKLKRICSQLVAQESFVSKLQSYQKPKLNGTRYGLLQLVILIHIDKVSPIFNLPVKTVVRELLNSSLTVVSPQTLRRRIVAYVKDKILPDSTDEGITRGKKPRVPDNQLATLNTKVFQHSGKIETDKDLSKKMYF